MTLPQHSRKPCPPHRGQCTHRLDEHTAKSGCTHRKPSGAVCGCTYTTGAEQGASPFGSVTLAAVTEPALPKSTTITPTERENTMTDQLWNIAGVAAELNVTPQAASAWHRGPIETPAPDFKVVNTGLELWNIESIEKWHAWVEAQEAEKKAAKEAKAKPAPAAAEPEIEVDIPHETSDEPVTPAESKVDEQMPTRSRSKDRATA